MCATYITDCASSVKDFIYAGTAGWSSQASVHSGTIGLWALNASIRVCRVIAVMDCQWARLSQIGGALNAVSGVPGSCTPNVATTRTRIGDVAITPYSGDNCCSCMHAWRGVAL